jgi:integrase/recombinase XerD
MSNPRPSPKRQPKHGNIFWNGSVLWARWKIQGKDFKRSTGFRKESITAADYEVAKARAEEWRKQSLALLKFMDAKMLVPDFMKLWEQIYLPERAVVDKTIKRYKCSLAQLGHWIDKRYIHEINENLIDAIVAERIQHVTTATLKRDLGALASVLSFAKQRRMIGVNYAAERLENMKEKKYPIVLPSQIDVEKVIQRAPGNFAHLIRAAWVTGCRQDELVTSTRNNLDINRQELTIIGKRNKLRTISLQPFNGTNLFKQLPAHIHSPLLFWHDEGEPYRCVASHFYRLVHQIEADTPNFRPFRFHDLRHLFAVSYLRDGIGTIRELQLHLGHESVATTEQHYLKYLTPGQQVQARYGKLASA